MQQKHKIFQDIPIVARATPQGSSALSVLRCSGQGILDIASRVFVGKDSITRLPIRSANLGWIIDPTTQERIDQVMATLFRSPSSYTGEDMVEISTHGGSTISEEVMKILLNNGCQPAQPGDFTRRAFINGKMNLMQAEAVRDIVASRTAAQRRAALFALEKDSFDPFSHIKSSLEEWLIKVETSIEFPDEEHLSQWRRRDLMSAMSRIAGKIDGILSDFSRGKKIREGLLVPIIGRPNSGKSTLFNWFCKTERVIVDAIPGTTRDAVEEELEIAGVRVRLVDTAGIRRATNRVEKRGIKKTEEYLEKADILLWISDASKKESALEKAWLSRTSDKPMLSIHNKSDLLARPPKSVKCVSLKTGRGLRILSRQFHKLLKVETTVGLNSSPGSAFQESCLKRAQIKLNSLLANLRGSKTIQEELVSEDIKEVLSCFDPLMGKISSEEMLNRIFSEFCIGK